MRRKKYHLVTQLCATSDTEHNELVQRFEFRSTQLSSRSKGSLQLDPDYEPTVMVQILLYASFFFLLSSLSSVKCPLITTYNVKSYLKMDICCQMAQILFKSQLSQRNNQDGDLVSSKCIQTLDGQCYA